MGDAATPDIAQPTVTGMKPDPPTIAATQQLDESRMDLLLWRHAEAVDGLPDHSRELTLRGHKQARAMAAWLKRNQPRNLRVLASPTTRTIETVRAFTSDFEKVPALGPDGNVAEMLAAAGWPDSGNAVLIVGHQPALGRLAALLLSGEEAAWTVKKGALWWFTNRVRDGETQTVLRAVIPHDLA